MSKPILIKNVLGPLLVILLGRISTVHQDIQNIEASYEYVRRRLTALYDGPVEIKCFGERGSGWNLKRQSIIDAEAEIRTGKYDLVMMEDLGRAYRNPQYQYRLAHICVDHDTRMICFGDAIDTAEESWEAMLSLAVTRHGLMVPETRRRVRRTADHAFKNGGMVLHVKYGYRKLSREEAESGRFGPVGLRIAKASDATPNIMEMRRRVLRGDSYESIAEWLNDEKVPVGHKCVIKKWTARLVVSLLRSRLLQGIRRFRDNEHRLVYETGETRRVPNPNPETVLVPELAHMTAEEQQEMWDAMDRYSPPRNQPNRRGTARKDSYWPGQHLVCSNCGGTCYWSPNNRLKCCNARPGVATCWNQTLVDAEQIRTKVLPLILDHMRQLPELWQMLRGWVNSELERQQRRQARLSDDGSRRVRELEQRRNRITRLLIDAENSEGLLIEQQAAEKELNAARQALAESLQCQQTQELSSTYTDVEGHFDEVVLHLARTSYEFGRLMRRTFVPMVLVPIQSLDTPQVHPRVKMRLPPLPGQIEPTTLVVDPFEQSKPHAYVRAVRDLQSRNPGKSILWVSQQLNIAWEIADRASKYAALMAERGVDDLYVELKTAPEKASRWRKESLADGRSQTSSTDSLPNHDADDPLELELAG